ncbi:MAG TPA: TMEM175 family protein [Gemmatimonadaceae bacterium]|nr:TMEM175 family protein [Gemmatimonadaceae bacterium]
MLRGTLIQKDVGVRSGFRWRSREISRIEALSDAVFGFAITLLIVSLEVPRTFGELERVLYGFVPFAISFAMLVWIWYHQYEWFRRYGLQDGITIWLNVILLFVVLFYIYPLKFLFGVLINQFAGNVEFVRDGATRAMAIRTDSGLLNVITYEQWPALMMVYAVGFIAIWTLFVLLDMHAYRKRDELALTALEAFDTRASAMQHMLLALIGVASFVVSMFGGRATPIAGWIYGLIGPALGTFWTIMGRKREALTRQETAPAPEAMLATPTSVAPNA